jgi:very-short-patch-repair endonuclease
MMDNKALIQAHIHSLVLEVIDEPRLPSRAREILDLDQEVYPMFANLRADLESAVKGAFTRIVEAIKDGFADEMRQFSWFTEEFVRNEVEGFVDRLDTRYERWRAEYRQLCEEDNEIHRITQSQGPKRELTWRKEVVTTKLRKMREGEDSFYTYRYLGSEGFLPNYAFPRQATTLSFFEDDSDLERDPILALREYAPGNSVYYRGSRYVITTCRPRTRVDKPDFEPLLICPTCSAAYLGAEANRAACRACGTDLTNRHPNPHGLSMPDMLARSRQHITSDEEERLRLGYIVTPHYEMGATVNRFECKLDGQVALTLSYEHNARIILVNEGTHKEHQDDGEPGFVLCQACNRWLAGEGAIKKHSEGEEACTKGGSKDDIVRGVMLYTDSRHDVVALECPLPESVSPDDAESFYVTLRHALEAGAQLALSLDESEIDSFAGAVPEGHVTRPIVIYETAEGGVGAVQAFLDTDRFRTILERTLKLLHDGEEGCDKACYDCLCSFYNQIDHENMDRQLVLPMLRQVTRATIEPVGHHGSSFDDLLSSCQSDFEKKVLARIKDRNVSLPAESQKTIVIDGKPVASADFFYPPKLIVFVDGSPHHKDYVQAADDSKRRLLKSKGYRIFVFGSTDDLDAKVDVLRGWMQ